MKKIKNISMFKDLHKATFIDRPNRFVLNCMLNNKKVAASLPNPGRLSELLFPGCEVFLTYSDKPSRKTRYTAVSVIKEGFPVMLHTHKTNEVARKLLENKLIPGLEDAVIVRAEVPFGNSRFDFLLRRNQKDLYVEVKSCTLFGNKVAMFPDAVTERGRKHLTELSYMKKEGINSAVIFIIHYSEAEYFLPDYHTDILFAQTFLECRESIDFFPLAVKWEDDLSLSLQVKQAIIPWKTIEEEACDRGSYLILLKVKEEKKIAIGKLGDIIFQPGYYIYAGSAMNNLSKRVKRHLRLRKNLHWHIDYLRQEAEIVTDLPVRSSQDLECEIASAISRISDLSIARFGSSDCNCQSHLFYFKENPLDKKQFMKLIEYFRMDRLFQCNMLH